MIRNTRITSHIKWPLFVGKLWITLGRLVIQKLFTIPATQSQQIRPWRQLPPLCVGGGLEEPHHNCRPVGPLTSNLGRPKGLHQRFAFRHRSAFTSTPLSGRGPPGGGGLSQICSARQSPSESKYLCYWPRSCLWSSGPCVDFSEQYCGVVRRCCDPDWDQGVG